MFISSFVKRSQSRRLKATEVRDELHRAFGETAVSYFSLTTIRVAMKRLGFSYRKSSVRPPLAFSSNNQKFAAECTQHLSHLYHSGEKLCFINECGFNGRGAEDKGLYTWATTGASGPKVQVQKESQFYSLILAATDRRVILAMLLKTTNNSTSFKYFLSKLASLYHGTLVMDNASIHHASNERNKDMGFKTVYLAPYLPEANACEFLFRTIKQKLRQTCVKGTPENIAQVVRYLDRDHCEQAVRNAVLSGHCYN